MKSYLFVVGLSVLLIGQRAFVTAHSHGDSDDEEHSCHYGLYGTFPLVEDECSTTGAGESVMFECDHDDADAGMVYEYQTDDCTGNATMAEDAPAYVDCSSEGECDVYVLERVVYSDMACATELYTSSYYLSAEALDACINFETSYYSFDYSDGLTLLEYSDDACSDMVNSTTQVAVGTCVQEGDGVYVTTSVSVEDDDDAAHFVKCASVKSIVVMSVFALYNNFF